MNQEINGKHGLLIIKIINQHYLVVVLLQLDKNQGNYGKEKYGETLLNNPHPRLADCWPLLFLSF